MKRRHNLSLDDILQLKPARGDFKWETDEAGLIFLIVPKFKSEIGKKFCRLLGREENFTAHLDRIGSAVWECCDGNRTVEEIIEELKKRFPDEEDLDKRLIYYLYRLKELGYISI